jgi:hypothetical protein
MLPEFKAKTRVTVNLPPPSGYRQTVPAMNVPEPDPAVGRLGGGRLALWACVAVGLHAALFLAIYLTPPLRLKVGYGPDRWVQIMAITPAPSPPPTAAPHAPPLPGHATHDVAHRRPTTTPRETRP